MSLQPKSRFRINAKETAKGEWYFEATCEFENESISVSNTQDLADIEKIPLGQKLLKIIKETQEAFHKDGKKIVSDIDEHLGGKVE